ncbi:NUDIX hydrolase [Nocardia carnea]|uniref:NUDIX hydrolase n=1 Tax=Nocardia carnea TaxID=37328 RepID=UPI0024584D75|nr:NUDIX domain-containing protein [Nocardia carnea]
MHLLIVQGDRLLWSRRCNTGYADGRLGLVAGHLEDGEDVVDAAIREAGEEVGIRLQRGDLTCVHVMHHRNGHEAGRVGFFFRAQRWDGVLINREPEKCSELVWRDWAEVPGDAVPYAAEAVRRITAGESFSVHWVPWMDLATASWKNGPEEV